MGRDSAKVTTVTAAPGLGPNCPTKVSFYDAKIIGSGAFGLVYQAHLYPSGEVIAIKKTQQNPKFKNRELQILRSLNHTNIVKLKYYYFSEDKEKNVLGLILEYFPDTLFNVLKQCYKMKRAISSFYVKLYMYQLFRSLAYLHSLGICHRDIKPDNLLLNKETGVLKLCDFGSAKRLIKGETNVFYICSRYYRAPELLFRSTEYSVMIDVWSAGCILVELILGRIIFPGEDCISQLVEVIKVLGTPSKEEVMYMNKDHAQDDYPHIDSQPWQEVLKGKASPETIDLVSRLLVYVPSNRITPLQACAHKFFNKLREPDLKLPKNFNKLPPLFDFSEHELKIQPNLNSILIPPHLRNNFRPSNNDFAAIDTSDIKLSPEGTSVLSENETRTSITL